MQQLLFAALVVAVDQATKAAVANRLGSGKAVSLGPWLRVHCVVTRFRHHGLLRRPTMLLVIWTAALSVVLLATHSGHFFQRPAAQMGLGAALAGSASNLYDRLRHGAVIDFLDLGWWPASNLADIAIVLGVITALRFL